MGRSKLERAVLVGRVVEAVSSGEYQILPHARQRCDERQVSIADIECALENGHPVPCRDRYEAEFGDWSYCFEGRSVDRHRLRIIVAFEARMLVVTVVRLERQEA